MALATMEVATQHISSAWMNDALAQKYLWHTLFASTLEAASELASRNVSPDLFDTYVILGSRWFSHHESVEALLASGRYGDCLVLLRSLLEDTDLMSYFAYYPEDAVEWKERLSRELVWSDEVYRRGIQKFRMRQIVKGGSNVDHWGGGMVDHREGASWLGMESPRLWFWDNRIKLLLMVSLVYAFLLSLLAPHLVPLIQELLRNWCHRTGERYRQAAIPLFGLRAALSALWLSHPPVLKSG